MKTSIKTRFLLPALIACLDAILPGPVSAQTFTTLHSFDGDGAVPSGGVILSGNTLYGTTSVGGAGSGTVFAINTNGAGFTTLYGFTGFASPNGPNSDGARPIGGVILSGNTLYGTAQLGGSSGYGTVFALNTDGTGFTTIYSFTDGSDGGVPKGVVLSGNTLYGTTAEGGSHPLGTVFSVNTDGTGFTTLHNFTCASDDGSRPFAGVILSGNVLYGTTYQCGGVFAVNTDGSGYTNLAGSLSYAGLILSGHTLYGTGEGGSAGNGRVFAVNTDGTGFTILHNFTALVSSKNADGANPYDNLILSGNTLYGTATQGGTSGNGTVFSVNTDGTGFRTLYSFSATNTHGFNSDGTGPQAGLYLSGSTLYGTAAAGGSSGYGTVFSLALPPPQLTITPSAANFIVTWPASATNFTLQSTASLVSPVWTTNAPAPVVVNGQNTVTNPVSGAQQFFRLSQ